MEEESKDQFFYTYLYYLYKGTELFHEHRYDNLDKDFCFETMREKKFFAEYIKIKDNSTLENKEAEFKALFRKSLFTWYSELQEQCLKFISENKVDDDQCKSDIMWLLGFIDMTYSIMLEDTADARYDVEESEKFLSSFVDVYQLILDAYKSKYGLEGFEIKDRYIDTESNKLWDAFSDLETMMSDYDETFRYRHWIEGQLCLLLAGMVADRLPDNDKKDRICQAIIDVTDYYIDSPVIIGILESPYW